jgi:hypothetical protein
MIPPKVLALWLTKLCLLALICGGVAYWLIPSPQVPMEQGAGEADMQWSLPHEVNINEIEKSYRDIVAKFSIKSDEIRKQQQAQWHLKGVEFIGAERVAIIEINNVLQRSKTGDILPGDAVIKEIMDSYIKVEQGGDLVNIRLYK